MAGEQSSSRNQLQQSAKCFPDTVTRNSLRDFVTQEMSMPTSRRMLEFIQSDFITDETNMLAALAAAIERPIPVSRDPPPLKSFYELLFSSDADFDQTFKVHRTTVQWLLKEIQQVSAGFTNNETAIRSLCCLIYYLANKNIPLDEIRKIFSIENNQVLIDDFVLVSKALLDIGKKVNLQWPIDVESHQIVQRFARKHKFPDVMGVIGHCIFGTRETGVLFQGVVDDRTLFYDINATEYRNGKPEMREYFSSTSTFFFMNNYVPADTSLLCSVHLPTTSNCVVSPFVNKAFLEEEEKIFNSMVIKKVDEMFRSTITKQIEHFPRLECLDLPPSQAKWVLLGSAVVKNAVNILNDLAFC